MPNFTKQAIKHSFMKLLNEQPLSQISVRDIVEECGINRNSFYYHFQDIPSLIGEIVSDEVNRIIQKYPSIHSVEECLHAACSFMIENRKAVLHIYQSVNRGLFENDLLKIIKYVVTTYFDTVFGPEAIQTICEKDRATLVLFTQCELFGICIHWLNDGMPENAMDTVHRLLTLCSGLPDELLRRCREPNTAPHA